MNVITTTDAPTAPILYPVCPSCGHCPTCGQPRPTPVPAYPMYYPTWTYQPIWVTPQFVC